MTLIINDLEMNSDFKLSELFDRYLENDLNILERQEFELRLKSDLEFAESFRLHKEVDNALIQDDILSFRRQLERIGIKNSELIQSAPMVIAEDLNPEVDQAILEQDIMALRDQLNRIHTSVIEEADLVAVNGDSSAIEEFVHAELQNVDYESSQFMQDVDQSIMQEDVMSLRSKLNEIGNRTVTTKKTTTVRRKVLAYASTAVAAVFVLLVAGAIFLNQTSGTISSDRMISKYFQSYDGIGNKRGPSEDGNRVIELGIQKYNKGEYVNALELFEACISVENRNETILLYAGSSALLTNDPDKALRYFEHWDENSPVFEQVEWYSAGCYLKKNENEKAKAILNKISLDPEHNYFNEASEILKKIE